MGLIAEASAQTIQESLTAEEPSMPCLGPRRGRRGSQTGRHEATVGCLSLGRVDLGGRPPRPPTDPGLHITRTRFLIS